MAVSVNACVDVIAVADDNVFDILLGTLAEDITAKRNSKSILKYRWVFHIPIFCVLYHKPKLIIKFGEFRRNLGDIYGVNTVPVLGHNCNVIDLADALKFDECTKELLKVYEVDKTDMRDVNQSDVFAALLNIGKLHEILAMNGVLERTIKRLCENGRDIRARNSRGKSVLHEAVLNMSSFEVFDTIISQGGDVDSTDHYGITALLSFISKAIYYRSRMPEVVKILKLLLSQNPCIISNTDVIKKAIEYDKRKCHDVFDKTSPDDVETHYEAQRTSEKYTIAKEMCLLPWLYKYGFPVSQTDIDEIELEIPGYKTVFDINLNSPRCLKDITRLNIRETYQGKRLFTVINAIPIPNCIKDYILMQQFNCSG
ncbi:uncharacterized protein LOC132741462 [Ruditapes philippinarum]|uniref:uncharacterized protein LOC132741462 n=1 Tax=Ruditapes philippinarum TaxID=129788 RepID=UPI00295ACA49|nr:uncharacterized protein LOC132741462 [Ruditapes philippinarum]